MALVSDRRSHLIVQALDGVGRVDGLDVLPKNSATVILVESASEAEDGHEKAIQRRADHWILEGGARVSRLIDGERPWFAM